jgi:cytolysin-activating lysine-acyltransferase
MLLIREHKRARCQAEIPLTALSETVEPSLPALAAEGQEANRMDQSTENHKAPSTNGNGAQSGPASPFTEAAPQGAAKKVSEVLGEIVWLMSRSPIHKRLFIQDLEWFVMTPILLKQFRTFYAKDRPIGVVLWAYANEEVAAMLGEGTTKLRPQDWDGRPKKDAGGAPQASEDTTQIWIVEAIAPFGGAEEMVKDLKAKVFPEREVRYLATGPQGKQVKVA